MGRVLIGLVLASAIAATGANAQSYPARTVTLIVPFAAGGPADITGRVVAEQLSRRLGQQFIVENVVGAGGTTGVARGARAAPDGYTLTLGHMGTHAAAVVQYPNLGYKPEADFEPIGLVAEYPLILVTRKDFPAGNLREFVAYAKANDARMNMAHAGVGSVSHTGCLLLNAAAAIKPTLVPFTGTAPAMNAIIAGQVDYVCDPISGPLGHIRAGTVKGLAIASAKRHPALPDIPTAAEGGLPEFSASPFYGVFVPKGTPADVLDRLVEALNAALDDEALRKRFTDLGADVPEKERRGPKVLAALVKSEIARLTPILEAAGK
jgi:tripartite-type tricarboxylate transporter receptor subunit TctC